MFYGWRIVGSTVITQAAQAGLLLYSFSTLVEPLQNEFATSRAEVMIATTCLSLTSSCAAPLIGRWVDRVSARGLMLLGATCLAAGFAALGMARALWQVWVIFAVLMPVANLLLGQLTSAALVTRWFHSQRGRAMGISTLGTSLGGFAFPLILAGAIEAFGWRTGVASVGVLAAVVTGLVVLTNVVDRPARLGLRPRGERDDQAPTAPAAAMATADILRTPAFWIIAIAIGIKIATYFGMVSNLVPFATGVGLSKIAAASLLSALALASMTGKFACGVISDRVALKTILLAALAVTIVGMALLIVATDYAVLLTACLLIGFATGGLFPVWGLLIGQYFNASSFGRVLGLSNFVMVPLTAASAPLAGWIFDSTGRYDDAFLAFIAAIAFAMLLVIPLARREPVREEAAA